MQMRVRWPRDGPHVVVHRAKLRGAPGRAVLLRVCWPGCRPWHAARGLE